MISESNNTYIGWMYSFINVSQYSRGRRGSKRTKISNHNKKKNQKAPIIDYFYSSPPRPVSDLDARHCFISRSAMFCLTGQVSNAKEEWGWMEGVWIVITLGPIPDGATQRKGEVRVHATVSYSIVQTAKMVTRASRRLDFEGSGAKG